MDFIAEIGSNWAVGDNPKKRAIHLIKAAANSGATVVKFQLFKGEWLYRDYEKARAMQLTELPTAWLRELKKCTEELNLEFLVTPFYCGAVDILENLGVNRYKIASWDITHIPLLKKIASTKKPIIMSTGAATLEEIDEALTILRPDVEAPDDVILLHCTGGYPTPIEEVNLQKMLDIGGEFMPLRTGFSCHIIDPVIAASSVFYMGEVIECHLDLEDRIGAETTHSFTPQLFAEMVLLARRMKKAQNCNCEMPFFDFDARQNYRRDPSDWLRPPLKGEALA